MITLTETASTKLQGITTYETKEYISGSRIVDIDKASKTP